MKKLIYILIGGLIVSGWAFAYNASYFQRVIHAPNAASRLQYNTGTTTEEGPVRRFIFWLDTDYEDQELCLPIKDIDGKGYTYLTTLNGQGNFSQVSCL